MDIEGISAGNEEQKDQEQEDDETDVLNAFQSAAAKGKEKKGSKNKKMLMPEGYMTMPRGMGVTPPVYGDCDEAEPIEIMTEKEEMAMLTMIVLSKHLPQPNNGEATATELAKCICGERSEGFVRAYSATAEIGKAKGKFALPTVKLAAIYDSESEAK